MEDEDSEIPSNLTYAARNPQKDIIPPRANTQPKQTDSQVRATQIRRAQSRLDTERFHEDVSNHLAQEHEAVEALASKHGRSVKFVKSFIRNETTYKQKRAPTLKNALTHAKAKQLKEGKYCELIFPAMAFPHRNPLTSR